jgi:hypothetical protein
MAKVPKSLAEAARARAGGLSWPAVAEQVGRSEETVRQWPRRYPREWAAAWDEARQEACDDAGAEALKVLRSQLRGDDHKLRQAAARALAAPFAKPRGPDRSDAAPADDPSRCEAYLQSLDGHELQQLGEAIQDAAP